MHFRCPIFFDEIKLNKDGHERAGDASLADHTGFSMEEEAKFVHTALGMNKKL